MKQRSSMFSQLALPAAGLVLLTGTLVWGATIGSFPSWLLGMGATALVIVLLGLLWADPGSIRDNLASLAYSFFVLVSVVLVYLISANHSKPVDLTRQQIHTLTPQTTGFLSTIQNEIEIVAFAKPVDHPSYDALFRTYANACPRIRFEVHDPIVEAEEARRFGDLINFGDVFITSYENGVQQRRLRIAISPSDSTKESMLSNALVRTVKGSDEKIYFLQGNGMRPMVAPENPRPDVPITSAGQMIRVWSERIMPVEELNLNTSGSIPVDAAAIVIAGPTTDIPDTAREVLLNYLNEGGSVLLLLDPLEGKPTPNVLEVAHAAGVRSDNHVIVDPQGKPYTFVVADKFFDHPIVTATDKVSLVFPVARPLRAVPAEQNRIGLEVDQLFASRAKCWEEDINELRRKNLEPTVPTNPKDLFAFVLATATTIPTPGQTRGDVARVIVVGDSDFIADTAITDDAAILGLQAMNWLVQRDDQLAIPPRVLPPSQFVVTKVGGWLILGTLLVISIGLLAGGVGYSLARRRTR